MSELLVYSFFSGREYVTAWVGWKNAQRRYTFSQLARAADVSEGQLSNYRHGKRVLNEAQARRVGRSMGLRSARLEFFQRLVKLERSRSTEEREHALQRIVSHQEFGRALPLRQETLAYMVGWLYPALHELSRVAGFRPTLAWIRPRLALPASGEEIGDALDGLKTLGCIPSGDVCVRTDHDAMESSSYEYHRMVLRTAATALDRVPPADRQFSSLTVTVSQEDADRIRQRVRDLCTELMHLTHGERVGEQVVLQLNVQLFPLADSESIHDDDG